MKIHELKIEKRFLDNKKRFEIRKDDRNYEVGDLIHLNVIDCEEHNLVVHENYVEIIERIDDEKWLDTSSVNVAKYHTLFRIIYILRDVQEHGLQSGYCILGLEPVKIEVIK